MPKMRTNNVLTGVFLFMEPVAAAFGVAGAQSTNKPGLAVIYGLSAALLALFWMLTFKEYTARIRSEGLLEGMGRATVIVFGEQRRERPRGDAN